MAAASKRQAPKGSGTRNMPHVASATGELILRKFGMSSGALASGQGENLNKVLMTRAGNDRHMVNTPPAVAIKSVGYHASTGQNS
jgi:hypothetical protein